MVLTEIANTLKSGHDAALIRATAATQQSRFVLNTIAGRASA